MTKRRTWVWSLTALTGVALPIFVFAFPLTHSPRFDALEPSLRRFVSLDEFRQVAAQHHIPLEPDEPGERPDLYTNFIVRLDGSMWSETLHIRFRKDKDYRMSDAVVVGRTGKERLWWRTHW